MPVGGFGYQHPSIGNAINQYYGGNMAGAGKQSNVKKRVTKPDGTVSEEYFDPGQMLMGQQQVPGVQNLPPQQMTPSAPPAQAQMQTAPAQVGSQPQFMMPQAGGFLSQIGNWISQPENFGLLGQAANAIAPGTVGGNLGLVGMQNAQGQLLRQGQQQMFKQLLQAMFGGQGNLNP